MSVNMLQRLSERSMFKTATKVRAKDVGGFKYIGYRFVYHESSSQKFKKKWKNLDGSPLSLHIKMYFYVNGAKHKGKKREKYLVCAQFPYRREFKTLQNLYNMPVKLFSSDPSFKYYFAYALNKRDAAIVDENVVLKHLGESLTSSPKKRNPNLTAELTKHFFKFFIFIKNKRPMDIMHKKYQLGKKFDMPIKNRNA